MRRALAILKYVPPVLCGLLVVAWVVSCFFGFGMNYGRFSVSCVNGVLITGQYFDGLPADFSRILFERIRITPGTYVIMPRPLGIEYEPTIGYLISCPVITVVSVLLPLAIGPFVRYRFPLWSWFAFTALVAVELAYYLR